MCPKPLVLASLLVAAWSLKVLVKVLIANNAESLVILMYNIVAKVLEVRNWVCVAMSPLRGMLRDLRVVRSLLDGHLQSLSGKVLIVIGWHLAIHSVKVLGCFLTSLPKVWVVKLRIIITQFVPVQRDIFLVDFADTHLRLREAFELVFVHYFGGYFLEVDHWFIVPVALRVWKSTNRLFEFLLVAEQLRVGHYLE